MRVKIFPEEIYLPESVGKQPKYWFKSYGKRYLFKIATLKNDGSPIYNDVSECMASDVANLIGIPTAEYYLCDNNGQKGVITPDFLDNDEKGPKKEEFFDGVYLISRIDPEFKNTSLINPKTRQYYTVDFILQTVEKYGLRKDILNMIVFDALIGNRDRNPSNYGIIINHETNNVRLAPLYDSCASLGISMVDHRLGDCLDTRGVIVNDEHFKVVIHKHIVGKVTLDRFLQYKDKREWDSLETKRILNMIEKKRLELLPLLESGLITREDYHKQLNKIGNQYRKFDISTAKYQTIISYLTTYYPDEIEEIMTDIAANVTPENIDKIFDDYMDEIPIDRLNMAKQIVLQRAMWMTEHYFKNKHESRGKLL